MEEALRSAETRYRSIFENATEGIYQSSPQGRFLKVNPVMARIFGYDSPEDMLNSINSIEKQYYVDPADRHEFQRFMMEQGETHDFISWNYRKNGDRIWIQESARAVKDAQGNILYYEGFASDITGRKQSEEKLREAETKYRNIFENSIEGIFQSVPSGKFITANPALARMLGYDSAEELIADANDLDHKFYEQPGRLEEFMRQLNDHGMISNFESKVYRKDRRTIWISANAIAIRNDAGQVLHYEGTLSDITGRKQAEEELRHAKDDLETVLLKLQQSLERETLLASTDGLTGLCNHRHFFELAAREFQAAVRYQHPLAFVMFDLDYFKQINDTLGHSAGDKLLIDVAQIAAAQVRGSDLVARYGGDEFIVLLPHANAQQALVVAERIRASVATISVGGLREDKEPFTVTLSMGITEMQREPAGDNLERIIQRADDALYKAKRSGRNRVEIWDGAEPTDH